MKKDNTTVRVLEAAREAWTAGSDLRTRRRRYKRFTYGDQWGDVVAGNDGSVDTEFNHALRQGRKPMSTNLIRRLVKCVVGRHRMLAESERPSGNLAEIYRANSLDELDSRTLEEFLISGCAIQRVVSERRPRGSGVWVDNVSPSRFFINAITDPRGWDTELVGMLHDMSATELVMRFAKGSPRRAADLRRLYAEMPMTSPLLGRDNNDGDVFDRAKGGRCRVIEVWTLEATQQIRCHDPLRAVIADEPADGFARIEAENRRREAEMLAPIEARLNLSTVWRCRWMAPDGTVLDEYASPFAHGGHPFAIKFYPLTDGEVHSLVEDVIDQQIYVNRLITLIDQVIGSSVKGALLFPIEQKVPEIGWAELSRMWTTPNSVIPINGFSGLTDPKQMSTNATDIGARELLQLQMKMFEDVSGVSNALMGKTTGGGNVGIERYESEVRNATIAINDLLQSFDQFRRNRDYLVMNQ